MASGQDFSKKKRKHTFLPARLDKLLHNKEETPPRPKSPPCWAIQSPSPGYLTPRKGTVPVPKVTKEIPYIGIYHPDLNYLLLDKRETRVHHDATADGPAPTEKPYDEPIRDFFFESPEVFSLKSENFTPFLERRNITLVMFYDIDDESIEFQKVFSEAASSTKRENHAFAGVDCSSNSQLCYNNGISKVPVMRLYSKSFCIGEMKTIHTISADILRQYVEMAPVSDSTRMVACTRPAR